MPVQAERRVEILRHKNCGARSAQLQIRFDTVDLQPPKRHRYLGSIRLSVIYVREKNAPRGIEPIEWMLWSTLAVATEEQAWEKVDWYKRRWGEAEQAAALDLLKDPNLLDRILADFERCGVVGEETNKLVGYLAAVSRKLDEPLAVIIQSSSAAEKTSLMDAILAFMPEEERVKYSAMTGQSLFYLGETDLQHKILAIVEEAGAERASYALKLLQSEGELTIASTGKDPATGKLVTHEYRVEGPVMIFLTTTAVEIDDELLNRCLVLTVNEDREQTRAIHRLQREQQTLDGLLARHEGERLLTVHHNAQRLLRPLWVVNPYARELTFLDTRTRTRRDHVKYLTLIRTIALLYQHQRPVQIIQHHGQTLPYIEVTRDDIALANRLAHEVLGRSLDELAPQTRRLLMLVDAMVTEACQRLAMDRARKNTQLLANTGTLHPAAILLALSKPRFRRQIRSSGFFAPLQRTSREFVRTDARATMLPADQLSLEYMLHQMQRHRNEGVQYFIFCNLFDVHAPYPPVPNGAFRPLWTVSGLLENLTMPFVLPQLGSHRYLRPDFRLSDRSRRMLLDRYHRAIELMDAKLGDFCAEARRAGLLDDTLLIITSDHGEAFGEHGLYLHDASVWNTHLQVPLWIQHPERPPAVIDDVVTTKDLFGLLKAAATDGDLSQTILDAGYRRAHPIAIAEHFHYPHAADAHPRYKQDLVAAIAGSGKVIVRREGVEQYDLDEDPDETTPSRAPLADFEAYCHRERLARTAIVAARSQ